MEHSVAKEQNKTVGEWTWNTEVLWSKIVQTDADSCWSWLGATGPQTNLFGARKNGKPQMTQTQRILYMDITGKDAANIQIKHQCKNAYCLNPRHFDVRPNQRRYREDGSDRTSPKVKPTAEHKAKLVPVKTQERWWNV